MVQHRPGLELLVTTAGPASAVLVTFLLPLFTEKAAWSPRAACSVIDAWSVYLPDAFNVANIDDGEANKSEMLLSIVYSLANHHDSGTRDSSHSWRSVSAAVQWPASLPLSSQVVQMPMPSQQLSSVEILTSCEQTFLAQWTKRKHFIRELRKSTYDAVDFSRVFFMLQEQPELLATTLAQSSAPPSLQIVLVSLEFTPEFFLTMCTSDLRVTLLDGDEQDSREAMPVELKLMPSSSVESASESVDNLVREFLVEVRTALVEHLNPTR
ncbi:hypothetical protein PybrP1_004037 [[Pythium] brassicae (nom. inval.)]|nr:hypothetical protein PybrP1_004037 [[Pythium] brassicae (nom. inval.)]